MHRSMLSDHMANKIMKTKIKPPKGWRVLRANEKPNRNLGDRCVRLDGTTFLTHLKGIRFGASAMQEYISGVTYIRQIKKGKKK